MDAPTRLSFFTGGKAKAESSCLSGLIYHSAARETTKRQVKDEVILNSQSNRNNLGQLESVNVPCQGYDFLVLLIKLRRLKAKKNF